jgi:hypothetical protein
VVVGAGDGERVGEGDGEREGTREGEEDGEEEGMDVTSYSYSPPSTVHHPLS